MRDILAIFLGAALITLVSSRSVDKELLELTKNLNSQFEFDDARDQEFFNVFGIDQSFEDYYDGGQYEDYERLYEDNGKRQYQGEYDEVERAAGAFESIQIPHKEQPFLSNSKAKVQKNEDSIEDSGGDEWDYSDSDEDDENTNEENGTDVEKLKNIMYDIKSKETINNNHDYSGFNNNRQELANKDNIYQEEMSENVQNELSSEEEISYEDIDDLENNSDDDTDDEEDLKDDDDEYQDEEYDSDYDYEGDSDEKEDGFDSEEEDNYDYEDEEEEDEENSNDTNKTIDNDYEGDSDEQKDEYDSEEEDNYDYEDEEEEDEENSNNDTNNYYDD